MSVCARDGKPGDSGARRRVRNAHTQTRTDERAGADVVVTGRQGERIKIGEKRERAPARRLAVWVDRRAGGVRRCCGASAAATRWAAGEEWTAALRPRPLRSNRVSVCARRRRNVTYIDCGSGGCRGAVVAVDRPGGSPENRVSRPQSVFAGRPRGPRRVYAFTNEPEPRAHPLLRPRQISC